MQKDLTDNEKSTLYIDDPIHDDNGELTDLEIEITDQILIHLLRVQIELQVFVWNY